MARITQVESRCVSVPLKTPTAFSNRVVRSRHYLLCRIHADDGHRGIGFCYIGSAGGEFVAHIARELFSRKLTGEDPFRVTGLWEELQQEALLHGRAGTVMRVLSAIDIALWDHNARAVGLPLHRYLGAYRDDRVPAYASGGYYKDGKSAQDLADEAQAYVDQGFRALKIKVGRGDVKSEEQRIAAVRDAIGSDILLMLDANNAWRDLPTALRYMRVYESYDPYWIEEPFAPEDVENHRRLAASTAVPVATGEIEAGHKRFVQLLDQEAASIIQADAAVCGGITEYRRIAASAAGRGVPLCPHWFHDLHVHLVAADPAGQFVEYFPDNSVLNFRDLIDHQLETDNGDLLLPTAPGLGFDFNDDAVSKHATTPWT